MKGFTMIYTNYNYFQWPLTGQKVSHFLDKVALDDSFNRHACWKQNSGSEYVRNVLVGFAPNPIIVANLKKCLELCIEDSPEYKYFQSWIDKGYEYLAIDGNNRTTSIRKYLNNELGVAHGTLVLPDIPPVTIDKKNNLIKNHSIELKQFIEDHVVLTICEYTLSTRAQVSDLFYYVNEGQPLKDQEKRNALLVKMADEIRKISSEFEEDNKFYKNNIHYKFDELMVKCSVIFAYGPANGVTQSDMNLAYTDGSITYQGWVKKPGTNGRQMVEHANRLCRLYSGKSINPSSFLNLFMGLYAIHMSKNKIENDELFIEWFMKTEAKRLGSKEVLVSNTKGDHTYEGLCGSSGKVDLEARYGVIKRDLKKCPHISEQFELDPNRLFTKVQRYEAWERQNGKTLNDEIIPESEINDTEKWHADHIVPFSLGGPTTVDNCRLIRKEDNLQKGNRV